MSFFYELDVRIKLICIFMLTVLVFLTDRFLAAICLVVFFILVRLIIRAPVPGVKFIKNLTLLALLIILLQTVFAPGTHYMINPLFPSSFPVLGGMGSLKWEGFFLGIVIVCRLSALMLFLPVFTETTPPHRITAALCAFKVNYRIAFIITAAFNFISTFKDQALLIMDAQRLRGMDAKTGLKKPFFHGIKAKTSLLLPLMLNAMRKAQSTSVAMDSRAFGIYKTRTWLEKPQIKSHDFWFIFACSLFIASILLINYL